MAPFGRIEEDNPGTVPAGGIILFPHPTGKLGRGVVGGSQKARVLAFQADE